LTLDVQGPKSRSSTSTFASPATSVAPPAPQATARPMEVPETLSVPKLKSRAAVAGEVYVQASGPESGLLDAPADYHQLGWYRHGNSGALVLDGHVGYRTNPGPLAFIGSLGAGDVVIVGYPSGDRAFSVSVVGRVVKGQLPQQYFSDQYDGDLMLITCDYTSPFRAGHFQDNVYLVAVPSQ
jgi:sortase (surface protein transpeptidase)